MDILQPLPLNEWKILRDSLKRDWPTYSYYYYLINNSIKWKTKDPQFKLQIYCPNSDVNAGTFIGISTQAWCVVYLFTFKESKDLLRRALNETKVIGWNEFTLFSAVHPHFSDVFEKFLSEEAENRNIALQFKSPTGYYFKSKEECLKIEVSVPEECELRHLNESHIPLIHSLWPHRSEDEPEKSTEFLASMVRLNRGIGLFLKKGGVLVSWIIHFDWGGLGMLETIEEHKRKGYGKLVVKAMIKELAEEENLDSFAFVVNKNVPSEKLFESLGYKRLLNPIFYGTIPKLNSS
ncbi:uncharacterized protein LOC131672396 [Phymastichus coffea]|uniref:uncharacterized protein LOC131672396 n=1 Tax=Phymastichus coffea TaxID=108790 RepID=UPI00273AC8B1|nr:uncharacterized protein LOC131672396 [Phymastichus coffea]